MNKEIDCTIIRERRRLQLKLLATYKLLKSLFQYDHNKFIEDKNLSTDVFHCAEQLEFPCSKRLCLSSNSDATYCTLYITSNFIEVGVELVNRVNSFLD